MKDEGGGRYYIALGKEKQERERIFFPTAMMSPSPLHNLMFFPKRLDPAYLILKNETQKMMIEMEIEVGC